jgi:hypothetical protein
MPIDYTIAGRVGEGTQQRGDQFTGVLRDALNMRLVTEQIENQKRKREEEQWERDAFAQHQTPDGFDYDAIINTLGVRVPQKAMALRKLVDEQRKATAEMEGEKLKLDAQKVEMGLQAMNGATPETYAQRLAIVRRLSPEIADMLGETFDPNRINEIINIGTKSLDYLKLRQDGLKKWSDGDLAGGYWQTVRSAQSPDEVDQIRKNAVAMGVPQDILNMTPLFTNPEEFAKRIDDIILTPAERARIANEKIDNDRQDKATQSLIDDRKEDNKALAEYRKKLLEQGDARVDQGERRLNQNRNAPGADDPLLPNGVKAYLKRLRDEGKTYDEAYAELQAASAMLVADHPKLDNGRLFDHLDTLYGKRSASDIPFDPPKNTSDVKKGDKVGNAISKVGEVVKLPNGKSVKVGDKRTLKDGSVVTIISVDPITGEIKVK